MRAVGYVRVSTTSQDTTAQRSAIRKAAKARGDTIAEWFVEKAGAGTLRRAELKRLRAAVTAGTIARVYVFRLDRLARSGVADTFRVIDQFRTHGTTLITVADGMPATDGPWGDVVIAVLAAAAEIELTALKERLKVARERCEREGRKWGRPPRLTRADYPRLLELKARGYSTRKMAMALKVPRTTIMDHLAKAVALTDSSESVSRKTNCQCRGPVGDSSGGDSERLRSRALARCFGCNRTARRERAPAQPTGRCHQVIGPERA